MIGGWVLAGASYIGGLCFVAAVCLLALFAWLDKHERQP